MLCNKIRRFPESGSDKLFLREPDEGLAGVGWGWLIQAGSSWDNSAVLCGFLMP